MKYDKKMKSFAPVAIAIIVVVLCLGVGFNLNGIKNLLGFGDGQSPDDESANQVAREEAASKGLLILVNKEHPVDQDYKPDDLTPMEYYAPDRDAAARFMRAEAADAFSRLVEGAAADGIELRMTTAYRSYGFQQVLYNNYVDQYGEEAANRFSAKPGQSEHQTGLAVDVSSPSVGYELTEEFGATAEGQWLVAHAEEYGFILRYPDGMEDVTGYMYEPWHLRYVGLFAAREITEQGVTLEEYLQKYNL
jgi:D-alanyl-D-alanine carboxypeptidase